MYSINYNLLLKILKTIFPYGATLCANFVLVFQFWMCVVHWVDILEKLQCMVLLIDPKRRPKTDRNKQLTTGDTTTHGNCQQTIWIHIPQSDCCLFVCIGLEWAIVCGWVGRAYWIITLYGIFIIVNWYLRHIFCLLWRLAIMPTQLKVISNDVTLDVICDAIEWATKCLLIFILLLEHEEAWFIFRWIVQITVDKGDWWCLTNNLMNFYGCTKK